MTLSTRRRAFTRLRTPIIGLVAAAIAVLAPGLAHAEPPTNDDFDTATTITALPFTAQQDTTEATKAADDPTSCYYWGSRSVWYRYTAPADGIVKADVTTTGTRPLTAVYTGERGALTQVPGGCNYNTYTAPVFHVTAGTTYHVVVIDFYNGGPLTFTLSSVAPSPNDDFAAAAVTGLPATHSGDLRRASGEPTEATASCDPAATRSVWYRYTPERTRSVSLKASFFIYAPSIAVYRGTPDELSEVDCVSSTSYQASVFTATAGQAYHIRLAAPADRSTSFELTVATAPALAPNIHPDPERPSVYSDVAFATYSGDRLGRQFVSGELRFGDGTSAPITGSPIRHKYAADGDYQVEVTGSTSDGRTGTGVRALRVETHDVSLSGFTVPTTAQVGQTKPIKVSVANTRYDETVKVQLLRQSEHGYFEHVGNLTQWVAAAQGRKVEFPFAYTYTAADVAAGKTTFKVVATLSRYDGDARPQDNELVAVTTVRPKASAAR